MPIVSKIVRVLSKKRHSVSTRTPSLSHKIASTKRLGSYDIWQEDLPRTTTRKLKRFEIEKKVRELKQKGIGDSDVGTEDVGTEKEQPLTADDQQWLARHGCVKLHYLGYNWALNDQRPPPFVLLLLTRSPVVGCPEGRLDAWL